MTTLRHSASTWRRHARMLALVCALFVLGGMSCRGGESSSGPALAGTWEIEIRLDDARAATVGKLHLRSAPMDVRECAGERLVCATHARGTHDLALRPLLGRDQAPAAMATYLDDGRVLLMIGGCCDQGEIEALGRFRGGVLRGQWSEAFLGGGRTGTFTLRRL